MAKKKKTEIEKLTKRDRQKIQEALRTNPEDRKAYAKDVGEVVKNAMGWVQRETEYPRYTTRMEVFNQINNWPKKLAIEVEFILDLIAGEDIITKKSKKNSPDRWEIGKRFNLLDL